MGNIEKLKKIIVQDTNISEENISTFTPKNFFEESSYFLYELEDKEVESPFNEKNKEWGTYTKKLSPLFYEKIFEDSENRNFLYLINRKVPLYYMEAESPKNDEEALSDNNLSTTRDCSINDVPSPLQGNPFFKVWFQEALGYIQNKIILEVYNKLRYPFLDENLYLNASLLPILMEEGYLGSTDSEFSLSFNYKGDDSYSSYLNNTVSQRLESSYKFLDYERSSTSLISCIGDSLYSSGAILKEDLDTQCEIYYLQDLKYELLRRKFAGAKKLYDLVLASINRQGGLSASSNKYNSSDLSLIDKRSIRLVSLPGLISSQSLPLNISSDDIMGYLNNIPQGFLSSIFYTSSDSLSLRRNSQYLDWSNLESSELEFTKKSYDTLDYKIFTEETSSNVEYSALDTKASEGKYDTLDNLKSEVDESSLKMNIFDINADRLLFHSNTLQRELGDNYPYLTYPIAEDNSISTMDITWIDYIQDIIEPKSKVQESINYGSKISRYITLDKNQTSSYSFYGISYSEKESPTLNIEDTSADNAKIAYLWYCIINYEIKSFRVSRFDKILISKIYLGENSNSGEINCGIIPFTYPLIKDESLLKLKIGKNENVFFDDFDRGGYSKAQFLFTESDIDFLTYKEAYTHSDVVNLLKENRPSNLTKNIYFFVKKSEDYYRISGSIRVIEVSEDIISNIKDSLFYPDWKDMDFYLNPYLNFTKESASPLRHLKNLSSYELSNKGLISSLEDSLLEGPSENIGLCNLSRTRGASFLCNDDGKLDLPNLWCTEFSQDHPSKNYYGFYLQKVQPLDLAEKAIISIYGDNRTLDSFDKQESLEKRSVIFKDISFYIPCISFRIEEDADLENLSSIPLNALQIVPHKGTLTDDEMKKWYWNESSNGITLCLNISLPTPSDFKKYEKFLEFRNLNPEGVGQYRMTLIKREDEFDLSLLIDENFDAFSVKFEVLNGDLNSDNSISLNKISISNSNIFNYRIGASILLENNKAELSLIVNENSISEEIPLDASTTIFTKNKKAIINVASTYSSGIQSDYFIGNLYDLRLYNRGTSLTPLKFLTIGTMRELFSYSPSSYLLGYNSYNDLGIVREVQNRGGQSFEEKISTIRAFNRPVWDSKVVDLYPISEEEMDFNSPFYTEDFADPQNDSAIYGWYNGLFTNINCIEQPLEQSLEVNSVETPIDLSLYYKGTKLDLSKSKTLSAINTIIKPTVYSKSRIRTLGSNSTFSLNNNKITGGNITLPSTLIDAQDELTYEADLNLNYTISPESNFTNWYSHGNHIELNFNNVLKDIVVQHSTSEAGTTQNNHILIPLTIPKQVDLGYKDAGYLDRFILNNVEISKDIIPFLRAENYYNELRIPIALTSQGTSSYVTTYASKWDALRTLKEGSYYITCKYPFQILPFTDSLYDNSNTKYNYLYATVRFKIEVSGKPMCYENGKNNASDITTSTLQKYYSSEIKDTLESEGALIYPADNRTFPHRIINIDLYVQDSPISSNNIAGHMRGDEEDYSFTWKLLGTNHPEDFTNSTSYIYLTRDRINEALIIKEDIPVFFSKNYTSSFFIASTQKTESGTVKNSASADDDLISPIRINPLYGFNKEISYIKSSGIYNEAISYYVLNDDTFELAQPQPTCNEDLKNGAYYTKNAGLDRLGVNTEEDLDDLILAAGRSYEIVWDYSGYISEFSFIDKIYSNESQAQKDLVTNEKVSYNMTDSEKLDFARATSLLDSGNSSDYLYNQSSSISNVFTNGRAVGFGVSNLKKEKVSIISLTSSSESEDIDSLIKNYIENSLAGTSKTYEEYSVLDYISDSLMLDRVLYKKEDTSGNITYRVKDTEGEFSILNALNLNDISTWEFKKFYTSSSNKIYRATLTTSDTFNVNSSYYYWDSIEAIKFDTLQEVENRDEVPWPGNLNAIYLLKNSEEPKAIRFMLTDEDHFVYLDTIGKYQGVNYIEYLGNPYSKSSARNKLLALRDISKSKSRDSIINSGYFPYVPTEIPEGLSISSTLLTSLDVLKSKYRDSSSISFSEARVIENHHKRMLNRVKSAIENIRSVGANQGKAGVFAALSKISPNIIYVKNDPNVSINILKNSYVGSSTDELYAYYSSDRNLPTKNSNITITRRGLYSNNLIDHQDFDDSSHWNWGDYSKDSTNVFSISYVPDDQWDSGRGKDVCQVSYSYLLANEEDISSNENNPIILRNIGGSTTFNSTYEVSLNLKVLGDDVFKRKISADATEWTILTPDKDGVGTILFGDYADQSDLPKEGIANKVYISKKYNTAWEWDSSSTKYAQLSLASLNNIGINEAETNTIYVDSDASKVKAYVAFLNNDKFLEEPKELTLSSLSQNSSSIKNKNVRFTGIWYNISYETEDIVSANSIACVFKCDNPDITKTLNFYITKAVVRKSESKSHVLGFSDGLYTKNVGATDSSLLVSSHRNVVFKNIKTNELLPIQFNAYSKKRSGSSTYDTSSVSYAKSGLNICQEFIDNYTLGSGNKLIPLQDPSVRRIHCKRKIISDVQSLYYMLDEEGKLSLYKKENDITSAYIPKEGEVLYFINGNHDTYLKAEINTIADNKKQVLYEETSSNNSQYYRVISKGDLLLLEIITEGLFEEEVYTTKYSLYKDSFGVKTLKENLSPIYDIYEEINISFNEGNNQPTIKISDLTLNSNSISPLYKYNTNLQITSEEITALNGKVVALGPITLSNETVSALVSCMNEYNYKNYNRDVISITNIQLLSTEENNKKVLFEFEYPPIIYDEKSQHLSCDFLFNQLE